jgi:hypothetical protein
VILIDPETKVEDGTITVAPLESRTSTVVGCISNHNIDYRGVDAKLRRGHDGRDPNYEDLNPQHCLTLN